MKKHSAVSRMLAITVACLLVASPAAVLASGFQLVEQNASGLGNAYAGQAAAANDASAVFYNPANLTRVPGRQFVLAVSPIGVKTEFENASSVAPFLPSVARTTPIPVAPGTSGGDAGGWIPVPNGYLSWQGGPRWWLGLGVNVPFGLKTEWDPAFMGRFKASESEVKTLNFNPTVAVKLTDNFSMGAGANYQRLEATLSQSVAYGGITLGAASQAAAATGNPAVIPGMLAQIGGTAGLAREGMSEVRGDSWSWGWNVGADLELGHEAHLGASYRSAVKHDLEGDVAFTDSFSLATTGPLGTLGSILNSRFADGPVTASIELPATASVAASYEGDTIEILADWTWTGWSSIQDLVVKRPDGWALSRVPLRFQDTWRAGLGFNYRLSEGWTLRLGTAYDKSPVQNAYRTPRLPDEDRTWAAAGFQYRFGKTQAIDVGFAHLFVKDATSDLANQDDATSPPTGNLVGAYKASVNILSIQYRRSF
jgi:long-chain fatty acid transport protein